MSIHVSLTSFSDVGSFPFLSLSEWTGRIKGALGLGEDKTHQDWN